MGKRKSFSLAVVAIVAVVAVVAIVADVGDGAGLSLIVRTLTIIE
ncbi:MAG: hypothetical protein ACJAZ9_001281 [Neolewinella sp.]|jgi:hypothetical protein